MTNLISTIISSTAALVAIIGGFLVSRIITLSSEKNAIVRRIHEIDTELINKREMLNRVELILLEEDVNDFIKEHAEDILVEGKTIEDILDEDDSINRNEVELKPYVEDLYKIYDDSITMIENTDYSYCLPSNFDNFIKDNDIKIDKRKDWYEIVYTIIYNNLLSEPPTNPIFGMQHYFKMPKVPVYKPSNIANVKWYNEKAKERNSLKDEVNILSSMKKEQEKLLNKYGGVSGLWSGLLILAYSTIVGIVMPISLLPYPLDKYNDIRTRKVLLLLFFSGLASLFIYLCVSMYKLTKDN